MRADRSGEESAEDRAAVKAEVSSAALVIQALAKADRGFTIYLPNNPLHAKFFDAFRARLDEHLQRYGDLRLDLTHESLLYRGESIYTSQDLRENLAFRMYADGIRSLTVEEGVEPQELRALLEIIGRSAVDADEDDLVTRLWSAELPHVSYELAELPVAGGTALVSQPSTKTVQEGAIRRYAAELAATAAPLQHLPPPQHVFTLDEAELGHLRTLLAEEEARSPLDDMGFIMEAILTAEEETGVLDEFVEILTRLCGDLLLTGRADQALALLGVLGRAAQVSGLPADRARRIDEARAKVMTPDVVEGLRRVLSTADGIDREALRALVVTLGRHAVEPFCQILGEVPTKETRKVLIDALAETGHGAPELFLPFLGDPRWFLVRNTIYILRRVGGPEAATAILRCASHKDARVRKEVLLSVEETGDPSGEPLLLGYLADEAPPLRMAAARSLARRNSRAAAERVAGIVVTAAFAERELEERETFWEAFGALAPDRALPILREMLLKRRLFGQSKELDDTLCACAGLKRIGSQEALAALRQAAGAKRGEPREAVERTLRALARGRAAAEPRGRAGDEEAERG